MRAVDVPERGARNWLRQDDHLADHCDSGSQVSQVGNDRGIEAVGRGEQIAQRTKSVYGKVQMAVDTVNQVLGIFTPRLQQVQVLAG